jgi:hypothetical protein
MTANTPTAERIQTDQTQEPSITPPSGPAAAAISSAAVATCALGVFTVIADGSKTIGLWLTFYRPSGPLSGVTTITIFVWLATWLVLSKLWRRKYVDLVKTNALALFLLACGLLRTFPPFADFLLGK